jgi:hypothetical protein
MKLHPSKPFAVALFLCSSLLSHAGTIFTITGTSNGTLYGGPTFGTTLGYTNGASYNFVFETGDSFASTSSQFSSGQNAWYQFQNGDQQLWSSVGGSGVTGSLIPPTTSPFSYLLANNGTGTRTLNGGLQSTAYPTPSLGLYTPAGFQIFALSFALHDVANFTFGGSSIQPNAYFADYYGTYAAAGTINFDTAAMSHSFTVTSITISGSLPDSNSVPDTSGTLGLMALSAVGLVALRRGRSLR